MRRTVLMTGVTGTVTAALVRELRDAHLDLRGLARDLTSVDVSSAANVTLFQGDLNEPASLEAAFADVHDVWLVTPNGPLAPEQHANAMWAARSAGVERVVRLSAVGAAHDAPTRSGRLHALSEREIEASGLRYTVLRPTWFMQNLLNEAPALRAGDTLTLDMGTARLGMIDARDVAACAARILVEDAAVHDKQTYTLTGPRRLSFTDIADSLTTVLNRPVRYDAVSHDVKRAELLTHGVPAWIADMITEYSRAYARGWGDFATTAVDDITGRAPRDVTDFLRDHSGIFGRVPTTAAT